MHTLPVNLALRATALLVLSLLVLAGCASNVPNIIKKPPAEDLSLTRAQHAPDKHQGKIIRWGGTIISTKNQRNKTELLILAKPLNNYGQPLEGDQSYGRFIAQHDSFLDPAIYAVGRNITIYGKFEKVLPKKIDNYEYRYPLVQIKQFYLWEAADKYDYYDYPYWYDPWYPYGSPYYPHRHHY